MVNFVTVVDSLRAVFVTEFGRAVELAAAPRIQSTVLRLPAPFLDLALFEKYRVYHNVSILISGSRRAAFPADNSISIKRGR